MPRRRKTITNAHFVADITAVPVALPSSGPDQAALGAWTNQPAPPRPVSKLGIVLGLLQASEGASLAKLVEVTGWLPHTTRAALTGLRKRGYRVVAQKVLGTDGMNTSVYRVEDEAR